MVEVMTKIVSSLAAIVHTLGLSKDVRVFTDPGYHDVLEFPLQKYGEHPFSFKLGTASGQDGDIPGRIFSYCGGEVILSIFPVYTTDTESWRTWKDCAFCKGSCKAHGFYVSRTEKTIQRTWEGKTTERKDNVLQVAVPG